MSVIVFLVFATCLRAIVAHDTCTQIQRCVFQTSNGVIDLTPMEKTKYVYAAIDFQEGYQFNPCKGFSCAAEAALACHVMSQFSIDLIDTGTNVTCHNQKTPNDTVTLEYQENGVQVNVKLSCTNDLDSRLNYDEKTSHGNVYNFILSSAAVCQHKLAKTTTTTSKSTTTATHTTSTSAKVTTATSTPTKTTKSTPSGSSTTTSTTRKTNTSKTSTAHTKTRKTTKTTTGSSQRTSTSQRTSMSTRRSVTTDTTTHGAAKAVHPFGVLITLITVVHLGLMHC